MELPAARIVVISDGAHRSRGHERALGADELRARYGSAAAHLSAARDVLDRLVERRHYLAADAERWLAETSIELAATWRNGPS